LLHEFRRHYHSFNSIVHQVAHDQTDVFHLQLLLEDLNEFSTLVSQHSNVFPDQAEWQTLHGNLQQMIFDVQTFHSQRLEQSHRGRPDVLCWETNGSAGRPRAVIDPEFLRWAYTHRTTTGIAEFLGLSRRTVRRALLEQGLVAPGNDPFQDQDSAQEGRIVEPNLDIPSLIRWGIVIHGFIDGYSRMITALRAANNNHSSTVLSLFLSA
ncbi:hypothetical protein F5880DRAFT_1441008, partial [Lentinula raphanica]